MVVTSVSLPHDREPPVGIRELFDYCCEMYLFCTCLCVTRSINQSINQSIVVGGVIMSDRSVRFNTSTAMDDSLYTKDEYNCLYGNQASPLYVLREVA